MNHEDYVTAQDHWKKIDEASVKMDETRLHKEIEAYITANKTCALATGSGNEIRNTPIEYTYHDGAFFMFSEGGEKFVGLEKNKNVSLAIFDAFGGFGKLKGLQVQGKAEIIEPFSPEYIAAAEFRKIPIDALKKLPSVMNLIKVMPVRFDFLNSEFKIDGFGSRQHLVV